MKKINTLVFDFARVLLFPEDNKYPDKLNPLYKQLAQDSKFSFFENFKLNQELLDFLQKQAEKYELYIFTSGTIQDAPELADALSIFKNIYSGEVMGLNKASPEAYRFLADSLQKKPDEILFVDDMLENIQAAKEVGFHTLHFQSNEQFFKDIENILS